jgi:hypothetical protein
MGFTLDVCFCQYAIGQKAFISRESPPILSFHIQVYKPFVALALKGLCALEELSQGSAHSPTSPTVPYCLLVVSRCPLPAITAH